MRSSDSSGITAGCSKQLQLLQELRRYCTAGTAVLAVQWHGGHPRLCSLLLLVTKTEETLAGSRSAAAANRSAM